MEGKLMDQATARRVARELNDDGSVPDSLVAIARRVPADSWSGTEQGWTVVYVPKESAR